MDSATIAQQLQQYDAKKVNSTDALNAAMTQYGVPEIRNTVSGLRTTLANTQNAYNAVDPSVTGRTQGSLVTEAQRTKQVSNERAPIADQITAQGRSLTDNQAALQDATSQANSLADRQVNDWNAGRSVLQNEYDTTYKREQDQANADREAAAAAEAKRQFDVSQATTRGSSNYSGGGSGSSKTSSAPSYQKRSDGGFNFQSADGNAISAGSYAAATGTSWKGLLQQMANNGDKGASDVLKNGSKSKYWTAFTWGS